MMEENIKKAVQKYQCSGCICGYDISCYSADSSGSGCVKHVAGTIISGIGRIFLGMPNGFNRTGDDNHTTKISIFKTFKNGWGYNKFNIPVWKYLYRGHTLVRGIRPRTNTPFIHIFLEDCRSEIECLLITDEDINGMD